MSDKLGMLAKAVREHYDDNGAHVRVSFDDGKYKVEVKDDADETTASGLSDNFDAAVTTAVDGFVARVSPSGAIFTLRDLVKMSQVSQ